jgi:hypothetical protein
MTAIILGPVSCIGCHGRVYLTIDHRLVNQDRERHTCPPKLAEPEYEYRPCADCGTVYLLADFPLGATRRDGTRHPMRFCDECFEKRRHPADRAAARRRQNREAEQRRRERARRARQLS